MLRGHRTDGECHSQVTGTTALLSINQILITLLKCQLITYRMITFEDSKQSLCYIYLVCFFVYLFLDTLGLKCLK